MKEKILAHRKQFLIGECICLIFFGCFTFPVYNFSKDAPEISRWITLFVSLAAYYEIGLIQGVLFEHKEHLKCMGLTLSMTLVGLLCRYLLEFGEVSNTYNFILPNIVLHLFMSIVRWCVAVRCSTAWRHRPFGNQTEWLLKKPRMI